MSSEPADTPTREEIKRHHTEALKALKALKLTKQLKAIGERLALGQWLEAAELSARAHVAARAPLPIAHHLAQASRGATTAQAQRWIDHTRALVEASEAGVVVRDELEAEARELKAWGDIATRTTDSPQQSLPRGTRLSRAHTRAQGPDIEEGARAPVVIASPRDLDRRREALSDLSEHIRRELPPPAYDLGEASANPRAEPATRAAWIAWADQVARAWPAPLSAGDLYQISGERAPVRWLRDVLTEREALAARGLSEERRRALAVSLLDEAEAIGREALALAAGGADERTRAAGLKLALDSIAARSRLAGLDRVSLSVSTESAQGGAWTDRAREMGLDTDTLRRIGDLASAAISANAPKATEED